MIVQYFPFIVNTFFTVYMFFVLVYIFFIFRQIIFISFLYANREYIIMYIFFKGIGAIFWNAIKKINAAILALDAAFIFCNFYV